MCGIISSSVGHARNRAREFSVPKRYEFNRPNLYTIYPGIQSEIVDNKHISHRYFSAAWHGRITSSKVKHDYWFYLNVLKT